jgi:hypothetical protein
MTRWWERRIFVVLLITATVLPLLWPSIPPLLDLPGHMARYAVAVNGAGDRHLAAFYDYHWALIGNLGVDLAIMPFVGWLGVEPATKLVIMLVPATMAAGFIWAAREVHGRIPPTAPLALVFTYAYPFHFGFVNYALGMALVAVAFALWIRMSRGSAHRRAAVFVAIAGMIWITHAIAWVALCTLCFSFELQRAIRHEKFDLRLVGTLAKATWPLGTGLLLTLMSKGGAPLHIGTFFDPFGVAKALLSLNRDRWIAVDLLTSAVVVATLLLALTRRMGLALAAPLAVPALGLFVVFIIIPDAVSDAVYVKTRVLPWAAAYALLAIHVPDAGRRARWAAMATGALALRLAATGWSLFLYDASYASALKALDHVPAGSRIATFTALPCGPSVASWTNSRRQHLAGIAVVRRQAFVNDLFEANSLQLLQVRYDAGVFRHAPSEAVKLDDCKKDLAPPLTETLAQVRPEKFDYVWLLDVPPRAWPQRPDFHEVYRDDETILYALERPVAVNPATPPR